MKNSEYWEKRIADNTWATYNDLEQRNRALLEMYQEAALDIEDELYRVATKMKTATPMLSDMHKYNRLSGLKAKIDERVTKLGKKVESFGKKNMYEGFKDVYANVTLEVTGTEFDEVPDNVMKEMFDRPWIGSNFSKRLWKDTKVLANNLNELLVIGLTQGKTITEIAIQLDNRMHAGFNNAHRLIRTETMHYLNESSFKAYVDSGCKEVQIWAAVDERTCPRCGAMHGRIFPINKRPALPFHSRCRCTYLPVIDRNEADIDCEEARKQINSEIDRRNEPEEAIKDKMKKNYTLDNVQYKKYRKVLGIDAPKSFEMFQQLKYNDVNKWNDLKKNYADTNRYNKIIQEADNIKIKGTPIKNIKRIDISQYKFDYKHINVDRNHEVTQSMAQDFINNSKIAYSRWNGQVVMYISQDGCSMVNLKDKIVSTAFTNKEFDEKINKLLEVLKND